MPHLSSVKDQLCGDVKEINLAFCLTSVLWDIDRILTTLWVGSLLALPL